MRLSQAEVHEVATFYAHFDVIPDGQPAPAATTIRVCDSLACELAGAQQLLQQLKDGMDPAQIRVLRAPCMGRCDTAPVLEIGHNHIDHATVDLVNKAIDSDDTHTRIPDYENYTAYAKAGGYEELAALRGGKKTPDQVQDAVAESGLRGLGVRDFHPVKSGLLFAPKRGLDIWLSMAMKASRAPSRIATIWSVPRTFFWRAC